ncbi:hypothetical protein [Pseudomonas baetica]|uniref:hypothetical protein n=1 Tax=Pseudomonas baetica TaxID=674054 RepID=UPI0028713177|nr:hypothetical protein [Pseudomonas baetica]MDR9865870.1 hypothetical protein [Pseudomonas baetica]
MKILSQVTVRLPRLMEASEYRKLRYAGNKPRGLSQLVSPPRCRLKAGQAKRRPLGMVFPFQGLQRSLARFKAQPEGPGLLTLQMSNRSKSQTMTTARS